MVPTVSRQADAGAHAYGPHRKEVERLPRARAWDRLAGRSLLRDRIASISTGVKIGVLTAIIAKIVPAAGAIALPSTVHAPPPNGVASHQHGIALRLDRCPGPLGGFRRSCSSQEFSHGL